jgi:hypothetical protein
MPELKHYVPGPFRPVRVINAEPMRVFGGAAACTFDALSSTLQFEVR